VGAISGSLPTSTTIAVGWRASRRRPTSTAGAEPIESVGQPFDPGIHEIVATAPVPSMEPGIIEREIRRDWRLGDTLLRPAQDVVTNAAGLELGESWP